jgi:aminoglycoside phosphotransferase (APT) family kinase protein
VRRALEDNALTAAEFLRHVGGARHDRAAAEAAGEILPFVLEANGFRGKPGRWAVLRTTRSETDATVAVLGRNGKEEIVLKFVGTSALAARLEHEASILARLEGAIGDNGSPLVPKLIAAGELDGTHYLATHALRGRTARSLEANSTAQFQAQGAAARSISTFHAALGSKRSIDADQVATWSAPALEVIQTTLGLSNGHVAPLDAVRDTIVVGLTGRRLGVGWVHGDYWLGNVLVTPAGRRVTGIVDWDSAGDSDLQLLDLLHLLLYSRVTSARTQFGDVVSELAGGGSWTPHEQRILRRTAPEVLGDEELLAAALRLCWAQHVAANFDQSPAYATSSIWLRRNVRQVLESFAEPAPASTPVAVAAQPPTRESFTFPQVPAVPSKDRSRSLALGAVAVLREHAGVLAPASLLALAFGLWAGALGQIHITGMTDVGLISVLPPSMFVALAALTAGFVVAVRQPVVRQPLLLIQIVVLILIVYGTPALVEEVPRFAVTWRHVGIADYIARQHSVSTDIDAYFNWPGFFGLLAFFDGATGQRNALGFANWAPVVFNLLYLGPLLLIFKAVFDDRRLVWLGLWFFYLTNWIGQDYLSPQGLSYFLYLALIALLFRWFVDWRSRLGLLGGDPDAHLPVDDLQRSASPARRVALVMLMVFLFAALVPMHQLTPFAALAAISALVALRLSPMRSLPLLGAVLISAWLIFLASGFLAGHFGGLASDVGNVQASVGSNVGTRITGSTGHLTVIATRLLMTGSWWVLAFAGALRARRSRLPTLPFAALALAPFALIALQSYGGEMLLRIYLFALPFTTFFAVMLFATASSFEPPRLRNGKVMTAVLGSLSVVLIVALLVARYGNERMDAFTHDEVRAASAIYATAPARSLIVAANTNMPWKFRHYEDYDVKHLTSTPRWRRLAGRQQASVEPLVRQIRLLSEGRDAPTYVILTDSQQAEIDLLSEGPRNVIAKLRRALEQAPDFTEMVAYPDAAVFVRHTHGGRA